MGKPPLVAGADVVKALAKLGFAKTGQKGSHVKVKNAAGRVAIIPMHPELARGTLASILEQAGVTEEMFKSSL